MERAWPKGLELAHDPRHERPLVRGEAHPLSRGRRLDEWRLLLGRRVPFRDLDDAAVQDALDVHDHDVGERPCVPMGPERIELVLDPGDRLRILVFP